MCERLKFAPIKNPTKTFWATLDTNTEPFPTVTCEWDGVRSEECPWSGRFKGMVFCDSRPLTINIDTSFRCGNPFTK